jgi:ElaB/YqjD/DUF883 family membrane-anchored ribosome-binding protein
MNETLRASTSNFGSTATNNSAIGNPSHGSSESSATLSEYAKLQEELATLRDTVGKLVSSASKDTARSFQEAGQSVMSQMGDAASGAMEAGSNMAASATQQAKTFASEIESMARKNPLGAITGAVVVGVLIGMIGRGKN